MSAGFSREQLEDYAKDHNLDTERDIQDYADSELYQLKEDHEAEND